jgi:hypothetical protein
VSDTKARPRKINPRTVRISLEPLNITGDRVRFLCIYNGETYKLYMGNKMYRYFTAETLPDLLKERIAMINAFDWDRLHEEHLGPVGISMNQRIWASEMDSILIKREKYYPEVCSEIGWRIGERYALVVPYEYFVSLKGQEES